MATAGWRMPLPHLTRKATSLQMLPRAHADIRASVHTWPTHTAVFCQPPTCTCSPVTIVDVFVFPLDWHPGAEAGLICCVYPGLEHSRRGGGWCCSLTEHNINVLGEAGLALTVSGRAGPGQVGSGWNCPALRLAPDLRPPGWASRMLGDPKEQ